MALLFPRSVLFAGALAIASSGTVRSGSRTQRVDLTHELDPEKLHSLVQDETLHTFLRSAQHRQRHDLFAPDRSVASSDGKAPAMSGSKAAQQPSQEPQASPTISPEERKKIKDEIRRDVEKDLEKDLDNKIEEELEKDEEKIEENVEEEIEEEIKKDLAEEGIGKEERVSPIGERVLQDLDDKWTLFKWGMGIFLVTTICIFCLCYSQEVIEDSGLSMLPQEVLTPTILEEGVTDGRMPYGLKTMTVMTLIFMPLGLAFRMLHFPSMWVFLMNLLAIVPEAFLLGVATEELALHMGDAVGAMLNASFGNAVELIFVYFTLKDNLIDACVGSLLGSILSNHLVLLGAAFLVGGMLMRVPLKLRLNQGTNFDASTAIDQAQQLLMASFAITLPALFSDMHYVTPQHVMALSLAFSCFLMLSYVALVFHQLVSRKQLHSSSMQALLSPGQALAILGLSTLLLSVSSECMVHALDEFCHMMGLSQTFVGVVLLPLAGDISHWSAVYMAMRDKMDLAINIAMASAVQIALVIVPLAVFMGYAMDRHMTLSLGAMQGVVLNISAVITFAVLVDGKSNWLRGVTLITTFMFITVMIFFTPDVVAE